MTSQSKWGKKIKQQCYTIECTFECTGLGFGAGQKLAKYFNLLTIESEESLGLVERILYTKI